MNKKFIAGIILAKILLVATLFTQSTFVFGTSMAASVLVALVCLFTGNDYPSVAAQYTKHAKTRLVLSVSAFALVPAFILKALAATDSETILSSAILVLLFIAQYVLCISGAFAYMTIAKRATARAKRKPR